MKNNALAVFISIIMGACLFGFAVSMAIAQPNEKPQETVKADNNDICSEYLYGEPDIKTAGIFLCKDSQGNQIYEVMYATEDVGDSYFDSNKNFIAHYGVFADDLYPGKCADLRKYSCDRIKDIK